MNKRCIIVFVSTLYLIFITTNIYAKDISDEVVNRLSSMTVKEALEYSDTGNPLDTIGKVIEKDGYLDGSFFDGPYLDEEEEDKIYESENIKRYKNETIYNTLSMTDEEFNNKISAEKKYVLHSCIAKYKILIIIILVLILLFIFISVILKNRIIILFALIVAIIPSLLIYKSYSEKINISTDINNFILNGTTKNISSYTIDSISLDKNYTLIKKYNISKLINDYILKVYYCAQQYLQSKDLNIKEYGISEGIGDYFIFFDDYINDKDVIDVKYTQKIEMSLIYEYIKKSEINNLDKFMDNFITSLMKVIDNNDNVESDMNYSNYVCNIINFQYFDFNRLDRKCLKYFHNWYISADTISLDLPFGLTLNFEKPGYKRKGIYEIYYNNGYLLDDNIVDEQDLYIYYKDKQNEKHGVVTDVKFVDENDKKKQIYFNAGEIMYEKKDAIATLKTK